MVDQEPTTISTHSTLPALSCQKVLPADWRQNFPASDACGLVRLVTNTLEHLSPLLVRAQHVAAQLEAGQHGVNLLHSQGLQRAWDGLESK